MTVTLPRPDCVNILWTILSGLHLAEYVTKSKSKFRRNVNQILFSHYRRENGGHISRPQCANTLLLGQNSFYFADDILIYIVEFVLLLHMQLSYLKMNLKSWSAKYRPYCLCLDVLTRCGRDKVTPILKTTFSISFVTSGEIWIRHKNLHTWNGSHVSAAMLWVRDKMVPLSRWYIQINFPVWNCFIIFSCDQAALQMVFSVRPSVRLSVCPSVCHTFFTMFPSSYHHEIFRSYYHGQKWCPCKRSRSEVKGQGHRGHDPT